MRGTGNGLGNTVQGNVLAGAVTYFGFLSFFPVLSLGFAAVGYLALAYPNAEADLLIALQEVLPGLVGSEGSDAPIKVSTFSDAAGAATAFGLIGLFVGPIVIALVLALIEFAREKKP